MSFRIEKEVKIKRIFYSFDNIETGRLVNDFFLNSAESNGQYSFSRITY